MERSSSEPVFVGIDVAKDRLDVHLRPSAEAFAVDRDGPGLAALAERLTAASPKPSDRNHVPYRTRRRPLSASWSPAAARSSR
jgi:hypothetical protein